jgi:hypothetical protein
VSGTGSRAAAGFAGARSAALEAGTVAQYAWRAVRSTVSGLLRPFWR